MLADPEENFPDGLFMHAGEPSFHCNKCGEISCWYGEPEDFEFGDPINVCGRSMYCLP